MVFFADGNIVQTHSN